MHYVSAIDVCTFVCFQRLMERSRRLAAMLACHGAKATEAHETDDEEDEDEEGEEEEQSEEE